MTYQQTVHIFQQTANIKLSNTTFSFCLIGLFFQRLLQIIHGLPVLPKRTFVDCWKRDFLQTRGSNNHPT